MIVAVIPARGGSKRIPGKNIRLFTGKPMIAWSILAAQESRLFDRIIVSTDSEEIAQIAKEWGADVPFMRPTELSDDHTGTSPVFLHSLEWLADHGDVPEYACCIYPTAPFIRAEDLKKGLEELRRTGATAALAVTTFAFPILRAFEHKKDGRVDYYWPEHALSRSQDLPEFLHDAGQFYWVKGMAPLREKVAFSNARPVILPRKRVQDLDTQEDWDAAELMARVLLEEK